jgi:hypothetical protein
MLGYVERGSATVVEYTEELYNRAGRNVGRAFWDYYKIMGFIPFEPVDGGEVDVDERGRRRRPKSATSAPGGGSFNLLRLKEIAEQREKSSQKFTAKNDAGDYDKDDDDDDESAATEKAAGKRRKRTKFKPRGNRRSHSASKSTRPVSESTITTTAVTTTTSYMSEDEDFTCDTDSEEQQLFSTSRQIKFHPEQQRFNLRLPAYHYGQRLLDTTEGGGPMLSVTPLITAESNRVVKMSVVSPDYGSLTSLADNLKTPQDMIVVAGLGNCGDGVTNWTTPVTKPPAAPLRRVGGGAQISSRQQQPRKQGRDSPIVEHYS